MFHKGACGEEYLKSHIPGAIYIDVDAVADTSNPKPHAVPSASKFSSMMSSLGVSERDRIVVYDTNGLLAAPRFWWTLKLFGAQHVRILDGGLPAWVSAGFTTCAGDETAEALVANSKRPGPAFNATLNEAMLTAMPEAVAVAREHGAKEGPVDTVFVDARSPGRFQGTEPEPRPGMASGHMPGAVNLPYGALVTADGRLKSADEIRAVMAKQGVSLDDLKAKKKVVATCGSGMTAATVFLALHSLGARNLSLYDGSWTEYGDPARGNPVAKGN
jgi:thiosulfate/3-mercaptopyruvate sulfurtransferase